MGPERSRSLPEVTRLATILRYFVALLARQLGPGTGACSSCNTIALCKAHGAHTSPGVQLKNLTKGIVASQCKILVGQKLSSRSQATIIDYCRASEDLLMTKLNDQTITNSDPDTLKAHDSSLDAKAYERAMSGKVPRTMTAWEWEQWYAEHGKPESFTPGGKTL